MQIVFQRIADEISRFCSNELNVRLVNRRTSAFKVEGSRAEPIVPWIPWSMLRRVLMVAAHKLNHLASRNEVEGREDSNLRDLECGGTENFVGEFDVIHKFHYA